VSVVTGDPAPVRLRTRSAHDTRALGEALARGLGPGDVVLLAGDLGAGKTTLAQGIGVGLGVVDHVTSPTCTAPGVRTFLHADLYRLERMGEVVDLALAELVEDDAVAVVEWGDVAQPVLGPDAISVRLAEGPHPDERSVTISLAASSATRRDELSALLGSWVTP